MNRQDPEVDSISIVTRASGPCERREIGNHRVLQLQRNTHGPEARVTVKSLFAFLILIALSLPSPGADVPAELETPEQLRQLFDQGQYQELLAKLNPALAKSSATDEPTRYTLLMLKGETLLRTKSSDPAIDAFKAAALIGPDDHAIAKARAMTALVKRSSLNKYQPKTKTAVAAAPPAAIDILDPTSRKQAFAALFTDLFEPAKPQVEKAEKLTTLPPIEEAARPLADLRPVEIGATDSDAQSKALLKKLGTHASALMSAALKNLDSQTSSISKDAVKRQKLAGIKARGIAGSTTQKNLPQDLTSDDVEQLNNIISQASEIGSAAVNMQTTFGDAENFKTIETAAQKTIDTTSKLLKQYDHAPAN